MSNNECKFHDVKTVCSKTYKDAIRIGYPNIVISKSTQTTTPVSSLVDEGWSPDRYDSFMGVYTYSKTVDITSVLKMVEVEYSINGGKVKKREFPFLK